MVKRTVAHILRHFNPLLKRPEGRTFNDLPHME